MVQIPINGSSPSMHGFATIGAPALVSTHAATGLAPTGPSRRGSHRLSTLDKCKQQWKLRYHDNLVLVQDKEHRMRGTLWHLCMAYYNAWRLPPDRKPAWYTNGDLLTDLKRVAGDHYVQLALHLYTNVMPHYVAWADIEFRNNGLQVLSIEEELVVKVGAIDPGGPDSTLDDEEVSCAPDVLYTDGTYIVIDDYKTKARSYRKDGGLSKWKLKNEFRPSWQANTNLVIARTVHANAVVSAFNIARAMVTTTPAFDRNAVIIEAPAYASTPRKIRQYVAEERELRRKIETGELAVSGEVINNWDMCHWGKYGPCDYLDLCTAPDEETRTRRAHEHFVKRVTTKEYLDDVDDAA